MRPEIKVRMSKCISQTERESKVVDIHIKHAIIACHVPKAVAHDSLERPMAQVLQAGGEVYADIITADAVEYRRVSIVIRMVVPSARHLLLPQLIDRRSIGSNASTAAGAEAEVHAALVCPDDTRPQIEA